MNELQKAIDGWNNYPKFNGGLPFEGTREEFDTLNKAHKDGMAQAEHLVTLMSTLFKIPVKMTHCFTKLAIDLS